MSETSSLIDEKKNQKTNEKKKNVDWMGFLKATGFNILYVIIWGMIGANIVYFLHSDLDAFFPSEGYKIPYSYNSISKQIGGKYKKENGKCYSDYTSNEISLGLISLKKKLGMDKVGFPYSGITQEYGIKNVFSNLFGSSARYSYVFGRIIIKTFFEGIRTKDGWAETYVFIFIPIILLFIILFQIPLFFGFLTTIWGSITSSKFGWFWTFYLFGIPFLWAGLVGVSQSINFFITIFFVPIFTDFEKVKEVLACNTLLLNVLFLMLTIRSVFTHLV